MRLPTGGLLLAVLFLAATLRLVSHLQVRDGSILYYHWAADTDMNFYDAWARRIVGGDVLGAPHPYHPWHHQIAREVHERLSPGAPFDERIGRQMWDRWLGPHAFYQDPLYAYALAAFYRLAGPRLEPVLLWQGLLGLGIVALVFVLGCELWDREVGALAGLLAAFYAPLVFYESTLLRGALSAFLGLGAVTAATLGMRRAGRRWWVLAGASAGLAVLAHGSNLLLALALLPCPLWAGRLEQARSRARGAILAYSLGLLAALTPLVARNVMVGAPPFRIGAAGAYAAFNFISGHAVDADPRAGFPFSARASGIFAATDARLLPVVRETLATHPSPWSWLTRMGTKVLAFWDGWENADNISFYYFLLQSPFLAVIGVRFSLLVPLGAVGLFLSGRRALSPPALAVACGLLTSLVFFTSSRVRLLAALALVPFAAAAVVEVARRLQGGRYRSLAGPAAGGLLAALVALAPWWPREHLIRESDYVTGNTIARMRVAREPQGTDFGAGLRILEKQLSTEPEALRRLDPSRPFSVIPDWTARVAGSFAELHGVAASRHAAAGAPERAQYHARRAQILSVVAAQYAARGAAP